MNKVGFGGAIFTYPLLIKGIKIKVNFEKDIDAGNRDNWRGIV